MTSQLTTASAAALAFANEAFSTLISSAYEAARLADFEQSIKAATKADNAEALKLAICDMYNFLTSRSKCVHGYQSAITRACEAAYWEASDLDTTSAASPAQPVEAATESATTTSPVKTLTCCCCGELTKGRQWHNRDMGFGICPKCVTWISTKETAQAMQSCYGQAGVHHSLPTE